MKQTLIEFLKKEKACPEGRKWALSTGCKTVTELWRRTDMKPEWRIWLAVRVLSDKVLRKFACLCVREIWHLLEDERSKRAVEVSERYADGLATYEELSEARDAASNAAWDAACNAARAAACNAARAAARAAASNAAWEVAFGAAWAAASKRQSEILVELVPDLKG